MANRLLISCYWYPWNTSGSFRWLQLSRYINLDVVTCLRPPRGFYDETMPKSGSRVYRLRWIFNAFYFGLRAFIFAFFRRYDLYIFAAPPESLIISAYVLQRLGRNVVVDLRDSLDHWKQGVKWLRPLYKWCWRRIKRGVVSFQFLDESRPVVHSGYMDDLELVQPCFSWSWEWWDFKSLKYEDYKLFLECGRIPYFKRNNKLQGYGSSSYVNLRKLNFAGLPRNFFHPEVYSSPVCSWKEQAEKMEKLL